MANGRKRVPELLPAGKGTEKSGSKSAKLGWLAIGENTVADQFL